MKILVASCDDYSVAWEPFFKCFKKFWPDCPYEVYLVSETKVVGGLKLKGINADFKSQNKRICIALEIMEDDEILFMQEDYIINNYVDQKQISEILKIFKKVELNCFRLNSKRVPDCDEIHGANADFSFGFISVNAPYRVCCLPAIWKRETLKYYMENTKDIWDFEVKGTKLSYKRTDENFWGTYQNIIPCFTSAIIRGVWQDEAIEFLAKEGIIIENKIVKTGVAENR